jgi:Secretion system C-terminal sorting domain
MKRQFLSLFIAIATISFSYSQACIDTVENALTLLSKSSANGPDCLFSVKFCLRKTTSEADHIDYAIYHTNGEMTKTVDVSGISVGSVICEVFTFIADCNSTASFLAVGKETNNSICGVVVDLIVLPIRLLSFSSELSNAGIVSLQWQTASESNSSHFIVQQSKDGKTFLDLGKIKAAGESNVLKTYSYEVKSNTGTSSSLNNYYRLKLVDKDEHFDYSQVIHVGKTGTRKFNVYPNPTAHLLKIDRDDLQKENLKLINLQGQELSLTWLGENTLNLNDVNPGIYYIKYQNEVIRFIKE